MKRILFIDRDGTLIEEPADEQIDAFEKLKFTQGVFRNLHFIRQHTDFEFVMVSNQDGLGTDAFPENTFWPVHNFILQTLEGEGITFDDILIDRHFPEDNAPTRKPNTGLVEKYMQNPDYDIADSYVIGAFCGDECRGVSKQVGDLLFITIHGSVADAEAIRLEAFNMETGELLAINEVITFEGQRLGYVSNPFLLHADNAITSVNGISRQQQVDQPLYNMKGQRVKTPARHQLYLRNGRKYVAK